MLASHWSRVPVSRRGRGWSAVFAQGKLSAAPLAGAWKCLISRCRDGLDALICVKNLRVGAASRSHRKGRTV